MIRLITVSAFALLLAAIGARQAGERCREAFPRRAQGIIERTHGLRSLFLGVFDLSCTRVENIDGIFFLSKIHHAAGAGFFHERWTL